ncbi:Protein phosphatase 2C (PP2C)-like domain [Macleaya cordata]|uniref:protein-serine/threonine phosphatase n=1 Tax=Macleaya cordata TaxID=56857 RepID=A0A200QVQ8_MACCD|nr:Protein phosphatase 2C (PP2C)-like domain [Macleaya cordata]
MINSGGGGDDHLVVQERLNISSGELQVNKLSCKVRKKKPARLVIPETFSGLGFSEMVGGEECKKEFEVEGRDFCLASRKGRREVMEDGYGIITDIMGDSKQAFFGVFDGHGGRAAMEYVVENLGKNIISALGEVVKRGEDRQLEKAIKQGYLTTDKDFLCQDVSSGACAATVLLKDGELYVANVGDCRVVLSRNGVAHALTSDHHVNREDERFRIENSGGYLNCRNGVWRVQGSLAVSRAIGDLHLKEWIISEPEIEKLQLSSDCEFLVIASDGLWDKVTNQEAVDLILREKGSTESCKKLINISSSRGSKDDITVMVVHLQNFNQIQI